MSNQDSQAGTALVAALDQRRRRVRLVLAGLFAALSDLITKAAITRWLGPRVIELPLLDLRLVYNRGAAFGLGSGAPVWVLILVTTSIVTFLVTAGWSGLVREPVATGLIVGAATANLIDRLGDGKVVDMFDPGWWPTFNLADVWITVGAAALLIGSLGIGRRASTAAR